MLQVPWTNLGKSAVLVYIDRLPGGPHWEDIPECALHAELRDLVMNQKSFRMVKCSDLPEHGCRVFLFEASERSARTMADSHGRHE